MKKLIAVAVLSLLGCGPSDEYAYDYEQGKITWTSMGTSGGDTGKIGVLVEKLPEDGVRYACTIQVKGDTTGAFFTGPWGFSPEFWGEGPCWDPSGTPAWLMWQHNLTQAVDKVIAMQFSAPQHP
jgi:hypothetical protein